MTSLLFPLEIDDGDGPVSVSSAEDFLLETHLKYLLKPTCPFQRQVTLDAQQAFASLHQPSSPAAAESCSLAAIGQQLAAKGHHVRLRQARGGASSGGSSSTQGPFSFFSSLSHRFLVVSTPPEAQQAQHHPQQDRHCFCDYHTPPAAPPCHALSHCGMCHGLCGGELIVDPAFASQFVVPHCSARYAALVALLPQVFVGPACQLEHVLDFVCREMAWSFKVLGEGLPPWRRKEALLSKFLPRVATDSKPLPRPLTPPAPKMMDAALARLLGMLPCPAPAELAPLPGQPRVRVVKLRGQPAAPAPAAAAAGQVSAPWKLRCATLAPAPPLLDSAAKEEGGDEDADACLGSSPDSPNSSCSSFTCGSTSSPMSVLGPAPQPFTACAAGRKAAVGHGAAGPVWPHARRVVSTSLLTRQLSCQG